MKIIKELKPTKGKRRVVIELDDGECVCAINDNAHYRLGDPMDDVVPGYAISNPSLVTWCCITQKWVE